MLIAAMLLVGSSTFAQQKYAVLICGGSDNLPIETAKQYDAGQRSEELRNAEFWNDTFLMWEQLRSQGFSDDNIIVLFRNGVDYYHYYSNYPDRYKLDDQDITDDKATYTNVVNTFAHLAQVITPNDFLFVWVHGEGAIINCHPGIFKYLYLYNGDKITVEDFANAVNPINADKKVFWMGNSIENQLTMSNEQLRIQ